MTVVWTTGHSSPWAAAIAPTFGGICGGPAPITQTSPHRPWSPFWSALVTGLHGFPSLYFSNLLRSFLSRRWSSGDGGAVRMKIVCPQDELLSRLQLASRGVSQRSTVQILSGVLIDARNGSPELAATDMELSIRVPLAATVEEPGATVAPGRLLLDIVRALPLRACDARAARRLGVAAADVRRQRVRAAHPELRGLPAAAVHLRSDVHGRPGELRGHRAARRPGGVQGRVAAGADRASWSSWATAA